MNTRGEGGDCDGDGGGASYWSSWLGDGYVAYTRNGDLYRRRPGELRWLEPYQQVSYEERE